MKLAKIVFGSAALLALSAPLVMAQGGDEEGSAAADYVDFFVTDTLEGRVASTMAAWLVRINIAR